MNIKNSKKVLFRFIAVILTVVVCFTASLSGRAYASEPLSNDAGTSVLQKQSFFTGIIKSIFSKNPIGYASYGIKGLLSYVLGKDPGDDEITKIMSELDEINTTQGEMIQSLKTLETMVECEQLDSILNSFNALKDEWAPKIVYDSLVKAEEIEDPDQRKAEQKSYLLGGLGIDATSPLLNDASVPFDTYVEEFGKAISGPYKVTFTGDNGVSSEEGNIFWIYQQYKMRDPNTKWEHMATEDRAQFFNEVIGNYTTAAIIDILSLNARIEAVEEYNSTRPTEQRIGDQTIRDRFALLMNQMEQIADIADQWEVEQHDEYRYLWVPGHEVRIYPEAVSKQQPEDKDNSWRSSRDVGYNMEYAESMTDYDTPNMDFWSPLFKYNDSSPLINYDQVNKILDAYNGQKTLYSILKDEAGVTFPDNLSESNEFMLNPQPGHELTYRDGKDPAGYSEKQLVCYICPGDATSVDSTHELLLQEVSHWKSKFLFITTDKQGRVFSRYYGIDYSGIGNFEGGNGMDMDPPISINTSTIEPENAKKSSITVSWTDGEKDALDVTLYGNGEKIADYQLTAEDNWTKEFEWEDAVDGQGNPVRVDYSLTVDDPEGYTSTVTGDIESGFLVTLAVKKITHTVTFKVVNGSWDDKTAEDVTVTLSGNEGDVLKLSADQIPAVGNEPAENYTAGSWDEVPDTNTEITEDKTYTYTYAMKPVYKVIEGANGKVTKGSGTGLTFKTDGDYQKFTGIKVDDKDTDPSQYDSKAGSTVVTLKAEYIDQLTVGEHTIEFLYTDGSCGTGFEVLAKAEPTKTPTVTPTNTPVRPDGSTSVRSSGSTPKTGDTNSMGIWIVLIVLSLSGIGAALVVRKRDRK